MSKIWYAVQMDHEDNDWGNGSFDKQEAIREARRIGAKIIAEIDGDVCIDEYEVPPRPYSELIRNYAGMSRAEFSRKYQIPVRTLEEWDADRRDPSKWVMDLLARVVIEDKFKNTARLKEYVVAVVSQTDTWETTYTNSFTDAVIEAKHELRNARDGETVELRIYDTLDDVDYYTIDFI